MEALRELRLPRNEQMRRGFFETLPDGRIFFSPYGLDNYLIRSRYIVPGESVDHLISLMSRTSYMATAVTVAFFAVPVAFLLLWGDAFVDAMAQVSWLIIPTVMLLGLCPVYGSGWLTLRLAGPFPQAPPRTLAEYASNREKYFTSNWALGIVTAIFVGGFCANVFVAIKAISLGKIAFGLSLLAPALGIVPVLLILPVVRHGRKLRAAHERLERTVHDRTLELRQLNESLEQRVRDQVRDIERLGQLRHFFSAPVAEMILEGKAFDPGKVHRRELTAVSMDLRGFTAFSETSEPEEVISVLRVYHAELGILVKKHQATLEHFAGDGAMVFLNDPVELAEHPREALELAVALRDAMRPHVDEWRSHGFEIGFGIGIATGFATVGAVGYEGRWEYAAIGNVCNLASRLCAEAKDGQIAVSKRFVARLGDGVRCEPIGERKLKGLTRPVEMFNVTGLRAAGAEA